MQLSWPGEWKGLRLRSASCEATCWIERRVSREGPQRCGQEQVGAPAPEHRGLFEGRAAQAMDRSMATHRPVASCIRALRVGLGGSSWCVSINGAAPQICPAHSSRGCPVGDHQFGLTDCLGPGAVGDLGEAGRLGEISGAHRTQHQKHQRMRVSVTGWNMFGSTAT